MIISVVWYPEVAGSLITHVCMYVHAVYMTDLHFWQISKSVKTMENDGSEGRVPAPLQRAHLHGDLEPGKYVLRIVYAPDDWLSKKSVSGEHTVPKHANTWLVYMHVVGVCILFEPGGIAYSDQIIF
jgi:hypothetical protein